MAEKIVYFTKKITPESLVKIYKKINSPLTGNIAIKLKNTLPKHVNLFNVFFK